MKTLLSTLKGMLVLVAFISLYSCEDAIQSEVEVLEIVETRETAFPKHEFGGMLAFISQNDVYTLASGDTVPTQITTSPGLVKRHVALSHDRQRIAYFEAQNNVVRVLDLQTGERVYYDPISQVVDMSWFNGGTTLCVFQEDTVQFFGSPWNAFAFQLPDYTYTSGCITDGGDTLLLASPSGVDSMALVILFADASQADTTVFLLYNQSPLGHIRLSPGGDRILVSQPENFIRGPQQTGYTLWYTWYDRQLRRLFYNNLGSSMVPGNAGQDLFGARDDLSKTEDSFLRNIYWFPANENPVLLTYFNNLSSYVSIDWKP